MKLTQEQEAILNSTGDIRINAVAGSGKTTTIIEYARTRPAKSKILYLAFNRSVKQEAAKKFEKLGTTNVRVETAHSLAYKYTVIRFNYKVRVQGYRQTELVDILGMRQVGERHAEYILANHVLRFAAYYCNSDALKPEDLDYRKTLNDAKVKSFVNANYALLLKYTQEFIGKMNRREIEITHDFYLKKFQLIKPKLKYDYILFDEGQDASPAMLDVFFSQEATKVIVGDRHQQIYGWRFAVNSLDKADYATYNLSTSFRFGQHVAQLAMDILGYKQHLGMHETLQISGAGNFSAIKSRAIVARTNLGLLLKAIEQVMENSEVKKIYFEGNINSYTYAEDGTSLYDVLNLYLSQHSRIKDRLIRSMRDMDDLEKYIEKTGDPQMGMMLEIVQQYGNRIPGILARIKALHVENEKREEAELIFSTVHRCKGLEYDEIELVNDFIKEDTIIRIKTDPKRKEALDVSKLTEEINLLYVAATRARVKIVVEAEMLPKLFAPTENIGPAKVEPAELTVPSAIMRELNGDEGDPDDLFALEMGEREYERYMERKFGHLDDIRLYRRSHRFQELREQSEEKLRARGHRSMQTYEQKVEEARKSYKNAYAPWTTELESELRKLHGSGKSIAEIAAVMGRSKWAIETRLEKLNLIKKAS